MNHNKKRKIVAAVAAGLMLLCVSIAGWRSFYHIGSFAEKGKPSWIIEDFLEPNEYSRPQTAVSKIKGIVIHYVANPGTSAKNNRNYFNQLAETKTTRASSHFIVGLQGEILQCIPLNEIAYASNQRNKDTISIEVCHSDETGQFSDITYQSVLKLTKWLCDRYHLSQEDVIRHYDVTGKNCPKYYVENQAAWEQFKADLAAME